MGFGVQKRDVNTDRYLSIISIEVSKAGLKVLHTFNHIGKQVKLNDISCEHMYMR